MYFDLLNRHLSVASLRGAQELLQRDGRGYWNVVSIMSPEHAKPVFAFARKTIYLTFHDVDTDKLGQGWVAARPEDLSRVVLFWDETAGEPMLIHCWAGLSRSTGLALGLVARELWGLSNLADQAAQILLQVRPQAQPNAHIVRTVLQQFLSEKDAGLWAHRLLENQDFQVNRLQAQRLAQDGA